MKKKTPNDRHDRHKTPRRWVKTEDTRSLRGTEVHEDDYLPLDPRLGELRDAYFAKKKNAAEVRAELNGLVGFNRKRDDWDLVVRGRQAPRGYDQARWELSEFETWLDSKPLEYRRLYHNPIIVGKALFSTGENSPMDGD